MDNASVADLATPAPLNRGPSPPANAAGRCPVPHGALANAAVLAPAVGGCPVMHGAGDVHRTSADLVVRRVLRIPDRPPGVSAASAYTTFQRSMLISATRCTLTYVVFPFLLPFLHFLKGGAPVIGVAIGSLALVCDTFAIRRFFAIDHKWRWYFSAIAFGIMSLLSVLLVQDLSHIVNGLSG